MDIIKKAKEIKKNGGIGYLYVKLSNSIQDPIIRVNEESNEILKKL